MDPGSPPAVRVSAGTTVVARRTNLWLWGNDVWAGVPVSGLFFTGDRATATCCAVSRPAGPVPLVAQLHRHVERPAVIAKAALLKLGGPKIEEGLFEKP
jgi:hypothetical protein